MKYLLALLVLITAYQCTKPVPPSAPPPERIDTVYVDSIQIAIPTMAFERKDFAHNLAHYGVLPANDAVTNSLRFRQFLQSLPEGAAPSVYVPAGDYRFDTTIVLYRRPLHLFGDNGSAFGKGTRFFFQRPGDGIRIERAGTSIQEPVIENIYVIGQGSGAGFSSNSRVRLLYCSARGFDFGFRVWANWYEGGDASASLLLACHALQNKVDGFFLGRSDANVIQLLNCDSRDNGRYGFNEDSFLGNIYIGCMTHNNPEGGYYVRDPWNPRSLFMGCYSEEGQKPSHLGNRSTVVGGLWGPGYRKGSGPVIRT